MQAQNFKNHRRFYIPHHVIFNLAILILTGSCMAYSFQYPDDVILFRCLAATVFMIGWLGFMMRQHYALNNQNRIIRVELRLRYYQLTSKRFEEFEQKLTFKQLAALRFAPDEEFLVLLQRALTQNLSATAIKKAIKNWLPDYMRV